MSARLRVDKLLSPLKPKGIVMSRLKRAMSLLATVLIVTCAVLGVASPASASTVTISGRIDCSNYGNGTVNGIWVAPPTAALVVTQAGVALVWRRIVTPSTTVEHTPYISGVAIRRHTGSTRTLPVLCRARTTTCGATRQPVTTVTRSRPSRALSGNS